MSLHGPLTSHGSGVLTGISARQRRAGDWVVTRERVNGQGRAIPPVELRPRPGQRALGRAVRAYPELAPSIADDQRVIRQPAARIPREPLHIDAANRLAWPDAGGHRHLAVSPFLNHVGISDEPQVLRVLLTVRRSEVEHPVDAPFHAPGELMLHRVMVRDVVLDLQDEPDAGARSPEEPSITTNTRITSRMTRPQSRCRTPHRKESNAEPPTSARAAVAPTQTGESPAFMTPAKCSARR